jgi:AhpD family alkylhydroperoxidase
MQARLDAYAVAPQAIEAMRTVETYVRNCGLEHSLAELVRIRASQINGCAFCLHMHTEDARAAGESEARIHLLNAWRESLLYSPRERAALAWTEALTLVAKTHAPDEVYEEAARHFSPEELVNLTLLIGVINAWNRLAIGLRNVHPSDRRNAHMETAAA